MTIRCRFAMPAIVLTAALAVLSLPVDQALGEDSRPVFRGAESIGGPVTPTLFEGDLRDLPLIPEWRFGDPIRVVPRRFTLPPNAGQGDPLARPPRPVRDPLLDAQERALPPIGGSSLVLDLNFAGQGFNGVEPPDPVGEVGPGLYVQMLNAPAGTGVTFYDTSDGSVVAGPFTLGDLGSGNCASGFGDPIAVYDTQADRWVLTEFAFEGFFGGVACVYVSRTPDPITGGWHAYEFDTPEFPDYPKYGVWSDAYYMTSNETQPAVYAFDRENMLAGRTARPFQRLTATILAGFGFQALTPADLDGRTPPPPGSPAYLARHRDDEAHNFDNDPDVDFIEVWQFIVDWDDPSNSTLSLFESLDVAEFDSSLCGLFTFSCIQQPGGADLDPLREVVMWRLAYRNLGSHESLAGNFVTDVTGSDDAGIRWFELRRSGGPWSLYQEGTYAPTAVNRWMASGALDNQGNFAIGYNASSTSIFPGLRYTGRLESDPLGTLPEPEAVLVAGGGSNPGNRYGDYNAMSIDPTDDCTFWFTGEYNPSSNWATRIGSLRFSGCTPPPVPAIDNVTPCLAGQTNTWLLSGVTPNGQVTVRCNVQGLTNVFEVGTATANANGDASVDRMVPDQASGRTIECQAQDETTQTLSPVILKSFP